MRIRTPGSAALLALAACSGKPAPAKTDTVAKAAAPMAPALGPGEAMLAVNGGTIWYRTSGTATGTPAILLHGGPGVSSFYLKSLEALGSDRPVVRYDQLGSGKSGPLTDTTQFKIDRFVRELDSLRSHLGYDRVNLIGHSWGTIVALEYYRAHPEHVTSLTLASAFIDLPTWTRNTRRLVGTLSDSAQQAVRRREADGQFTAPDYQAATAEYFHRYMSRHPIPADGDSIQRTMNEPLYEYMQGPSEFTIVGTLKNYDATPFLKNVRVPVVYTVGEFDEADPATVKHFASLTPGAKVVVIPGSAHMTTWDNPAAMTAAVRDFLRHVDSTSTTVQKK